MNRGSKCDLTIVVKTIDLLAVQICTKTPVTFPALRARKRVITGTIQQLLFDSLVMSLFLLPEDTIIKNILVYLDPLDLACVAKVSSEHYQ